MGSEKNGSSGDESLDAIGLGLVVRDITVLLDHYPAADEKVPARELFESGGGPVPTALVAMARLGSRCAIASVVGDDAVGLGLIQELAREGVDVASVRKDGSFTSPTSVIMVEGSRRTILEAPRSGSGLPYPPAAVEELPIESCRALLIDARMAEAQRQAAIRARAAGALVVLDCGHPRPGVEELLAVTDVAILSHTYPKAALGNAYDARAFLEELQAELPWDGPRIVGLTLGAEGCLLKSRDTPFTHLPGVSVEVADSTGAGDVFHGAFTHALLDGEPVERAGRFANATAAFKCRGMTGRAPIPPASEIWGLVDTGT